MDRQFDVSARRAVFEERAQNLKGLFSYFFEKHTRLRRNAAPWVRQLVTLGTSPVKVVWQQDEREIRFLESILGEDGKPTGKWESKADQIVSCIGPTFRPVDLFAFYVFPYTVNDVDDAELAFEDVLVSQDRVKALAKKTILPNGEEKREGETYGHVFENTKEVFEKLSVGLQKDKVQAEARRLADKGFTHPLDLKLPPSMLPVDITECIWTKQLGDDTRPYKYLCSIGADEVVLRIQRVPFFDGLAHWLCGKFREVENEFYGRALPEDFDKMQYFINDVGDQASDALVWSLNPISIVDVFSAADPTSYRMRPGAKWLANTNPSNAVKFIEPPKESAQVGFNTVYNLLGLTHEFADVAPLTGSAPKTRNKNQKNLELAVQEAQTDVIEVVRNIEVAVMEPFLGKAYKLTEQFLDRDILLRIQGADGATMIEKAVGVADIIGDYEFSWLGSTRVLNEQVRGQQMIGFLGMLGKVPPDQLASQGVEIGWADLIRDVAEIGLSLPHTSVMKYIRDKVKKVSIDADIENQLFEVGRGDEVVVSEADNDEEHGVSHARYLTSPDTPEDVKPKVLKHLQAHAASAMAKQQMKQIAEQQQAASRQGLVNAGGGPGVRLPPPAGPGRLASTNGTDDLMRRMPRPSV